MVFTQSSTLIRYKPEYNNAFTSCQALLLDEITRSELAIHLAYAMSRRAFGGGGGDTTDLMAACSTTFISVHEIDLYIHIPLQNYYYIEGFGI